jgi:hypothetical protein
MVHYIKQFISRLAKSAENPLNSVRTRQQAHELVLAIDKLDPRDFDPQGQVEFMQARADLRGFAEYGDDEESKQRILKSLSSVLDKYRGEGSHRVTQSFVFIRDPDLRKIIDRDYSELSRVLFPGGAWKSTVIMAGSIVEAILYDQLTADPATIGKAMASAVAPKDNKGKVRNLAAGEWRLQDLIDVAADLGVLPDERAKTFDQVLRDYRNFVHPKKEIRAGHACADGEAMMAKGALDAICDYLTRVAAASPSTGPMPTGGP